MPNAPLKPCADHRCPTLIPRGQTRCTYHQHKQYKEQDERRGTSTQRGYGSRWQKVRRVVLNRDPLCMVCRRAASTQVDHIRPKSQGGGDEAENLQGICAPCHGAKSAKEGFGRAG